MPEFWAAISLTRNGTVNYTKEKNKVGLLLVLFFAVLFAYPLAK